MLSKSILFSTKNSFWLSNVFFSFFVLKNKKLFLKTVPKHGLRMYSAIVFGKFFVLFLKKKTKKQVQQPKKVFSILDNRK